MLHINIKFATNLVCLSLLSSPLVPTCNAGCIMQPVNTSNKASIKYSYNTNGQLRSVTDIYNNITSYEYNNGLLVTVFYQAHDSSTALKIAQYNYDAFNRIAFIHYYNNNAQEYRYKIFNYQDDQTGQLKSLSECTGSEQGVHKLQSKVSYIYNVDKNIKTQIIFDALTNTTVSDTYQYNTLNQLTKDVQQTSGEALKTTTYIYDADGNIYSKSIKNNLGTTTKTYINDGLDQLKLINSSDTNGNQQTYNFAYDAVGNLIKNDKSNILTYNPLNQLTSFKTPTGQETNYSYYPNNLLAYQSEKNIPDAQNVDIYYNDTKYAQTISEYYQANSTNSSHKISYIYGGNERLARQVDDSPILQSYISNPKGNVLKVSNNTTDNQGVDYQYTAYGKPTKQPKLEDQIAPNSFMYSGERYDKNTGLEYLRARFYNPELMRFINQDSTDLLNRFAYAGGNPIMNEDPSGKFKMPKWANDVMFDSVITFSLLTAVPELSFWYLNISPALGTISGATGIAANHTKGKYFRPLNIISLSAGIALFGVDALAMAASIDNMTAYSNQIEVAIAKRNYREIPAKEDVVGKIPANKNLYLSYQSFGLDSELGQNYDNMDTVLSVEHDAESSSTISWGFAKSRTSSANEDLNIKGVSSQRKICNYLFGTKRSSTNIIKRFLRPWIMADKNTSNYGHIFDYLDNIKPNVWLRNSMNGYESYTRIHGYFN